MPGAHQGQSVVKSGNIYLRTQGSTGRNGAKRKSAQEQSAEMSWRPDALGVRKKEDNNQGGGGGVGNL